MKPTLFWKILGAFWLTIILAQASTLFIFAAYTHWGRDVREAIIAQRSERERTAQIVLKYGGRPALDEMAAGWPKDARAGMRISTDPAGRPKVVLPPPPPPRSLFLFPLMPLAILFAASLLLSAALAANLARPISQLRNGLRDFAKGDLAVRLTAAMGRRRDEIA